MPVAKKSTPLPEKKGKPLSAKALHKLVLRPQKLKDRQLTYETLVRLRNIVVYGMSKANYWTKANDTELRELITFAGYGLWGYEDE